jgi:hypothetical protein
LIASNGSAIGNINGTNVSTVGTAQSVTAAAQTNITSVGTLTGLNVQGLLIASNGSGISNINSANIVQPFANLVVSNALTTTNIFANTMTLANAAASITGNLYVSNAVTTTNIVAAGFTSNSSNTIFNYDTLTIPFINSTTLNVVSTANVLVQTIQGSSGQSSLTVTGNIYVSNALQTTNLFANTLTLSNAISRINVTGNIYASNALTTTNVFTTNLTASGQISAVGNTVSASYGMCPPLTARQGVAASTNWNPSGGTQGNFFLNSGVVNMQAGSNTMAVSPTTITFPISYTNNPIVLITPYSTTAATNPWVSAVTTTNFQVTWTNFGTFEWISLGI